MNSNKIQVPEPVRKVLDVLHEAGYEAYIVGGCVRDHLMGRTPGDYDVTTSALPEETMAAFRRDAARPATDTRPKTDWHIVETGLQHGTVTIVSPLPDGSYYNVEVTTFRIDGEYLDNRHPKEVTFTRSLAEDVARRDFTINAMAYSEENGVIDLYDGQADLAKGRLRCVGEANKRFREDGLRILRALRFAAVLDFAPCTDDGVAYGQIDCTLENATKKTYGQIDCDKNEPAYGQTDCTPSTDMAIHEMRSLLQGISRERIHVELTKLLGGVGAGRILAAYADVIETILPMLTMEKVQAAADAFHRLWAGEAATGFKLPPEGRYALLFADCTEEEMRAGVRSLKMSRAEERLLYGFWYQRRCIPGETDSARYTWRKLSGSYDGYSFCRQQQLLLYATGAISADERDKLLPQIDALETESPCCTLGELAVNGQMLLAKGITGAAIGRTLAALLEGVLRDELPNTEEALLTRVAEMEKERTNGNGSTM